MYVITVTYREFRISVRCELLVRKTLKTPRTEASSKRYRSKALDRGITPSVDSLNSIPKYSSRLAP
jgi:hypothetical protein